jgi:hypothetical protein
MNESQLARAIKAHIDKGDKAKDKAEQHYIAAGQYLKQLKDGHSQAGFLKIVQEKIGIGKTRTYELLAIADGTKTVESVRADRRERDRNAIKEICPPIGGQPDAPSTSHAVAVVDADADADDDGFLDDRGHFAAIDQEADIRCRIRGLLFKAQQSTFAAEDELDEFNELVCTEETREAVTNAAKAWAALLQEMNRRAPVEGGSVSKPQPSIAAPSHEPAPAVDPWDGLDIPDCLRRAPKAVTS